jgi:acyl-CoA hydrolase
MRKTKIAHLVKSEDLNHHGTLYAGRMAEWFVEACFINGAKVTNKPENIVCLKIHGFKFREPTNKGDILNIEAHIVKSGRTSFTVYGKANKNNNKKNIADGFITFVNLDEKGDPIPHKIVLGKSKSQEETNLRKEAMNLK